MAKCHVKTFLGKARLIGQVVKTNAVRNVFDLNRGFILGLGCDGGVKYGESFFVGHEGYLLFVHGLLHSGRDKIRPKGGEDNE